MLLYKKDWGRPIKTVLSFYNLRVFFLFVLIFMLFISKYSCIGYIIDLMETLQTKYYESIFDIYFMSLNTSTPIEKLEDLKSLFNHFAQIRAIFNIFRLGKTGTILLQRLNNFKKEIS